MERIKTYIEGFDELAYGGIPAGSVNLIAGTTGTMKSALAYYVLYRNAEQGKKGGICSFATERAQTCSADAKLWLASR